MKCKCWSELNERLKEKNLRLCSAAFRMPSFTLVPTLRTEWIRASEAPKGQKRNPPAMFASHCPFCGVAIEDEKVMDASAPNKKVSDAPDSAAPNRKQKL